MLPSYVEECSFVPLSLRLHDALCEILAHKVDGDWPAHGDGDVSFRVGITWLIGKLISF